MPAPFIGSRTTPRLPAAEAPAHIFGRRRLGLPLRLVTCRRLTILLVLAAASTLYSATLDERLVPCRLCHGESGQSRIPGVPSLGGQPQFFLTVQLLMFREKIRNIEPMTGMLKGWSDDDLRRAADTLARLPPPSSGEAPLAAARADRARALIQQQRCNYCHKSDFSGAQNAPRLAGQREDYMLKALRDYKSNSRRSYDTSMVDALEPLSDDALEDLAHYLARSPN
jgi:cytochrome c553